jgi:ParB family chromosome partitioning protein
MVSIKSSVVKIDEIDLQDHTFKISIDKDLARLTESIQHLGLIVPPLLFHGKSGYAVISGFRRIAVCRNLKFLQIAAGILDDASGPLDCAQIAIAENSFQRELNLIETSRALNLLGRFIKEPLKIENIAKSLGLPGNSALIQKIQKIQRLSDSIQDGILHNRISMDMAFSLSSLGENEGRTILEIFNELSLSRSKQKELLSHIQEISIRDDIAIDRLLASKDVQDILADHEADRTQKTKSLRDFLKKRRYPHLYFAEKEFFDSLNKIKLGNRISLRPTDYFEGDSFSLHLSFKDLNELKSHLKTLDQITQNPLLIDLLDKK